MSVRLFHAHARMVVATRPRQGERVWYAVHRRPVAWADLFASALALVGFRPESATDGLQFGGGSLHWTRGLLWTTIRLRLPPCSEKKAALLAAGLLKAARYASETGAAHATRE
jgi:hypothetical protein